MGTYHTFITERVLLKIDNESVIESIKNVLKTLQEKGFVEHWFFNEDLNYFHGAFKGHGGWYEYYITPLSELINFVTITNENEYSINMNFGGYIKPPKN